jgi:cysteine desulfurase/selenocysteine lyase
MKTLYLDNAATSWPKPPQVPRAVARTMIRGGGNPGRSGHSKSIEAGRAVLRTRELLAELFNVRDPSRIVFTKNATEALNVAIVGLLRAGGRVVTTSMEHNSVLRPLRALCSAGVSVQAIPADAGGRVDPQEVRRAIGADTRLVVVTHGSNVTGAVNDIAAVAAACRERGVRLLVDAAQTAGCIPIDLERIPVDYMAFSGHKSLLGPQGTGGLYVRDEKDLPPLLRGGTGSLSDREEQPEFLPDRFESGTLNVPGIVGLGEGVRWLLRRGVENVAEHDRLLRSILLETVSHDPRVRVVGNPAASAAAAPAPAAPCTGVVSVVIRDVSPSDAGEALERRFGILTRIGLHCAPSAHRSMGTFPDGTVRLSWGVFTTARQMEKAGRALLSIAAGK